MLKQDQKIPGRRRSAAKRVTRERASGQQGQGASLALFRIWQAPAVQALLLQCVAFPLTLIAVYLLASSGANPGCSQRALLQGAFAALLARWRKLAVWWLGIQLVFPLALMESQRLAIAPGIFLAAFLFLLALYWSTFRTQVPYYPSGRRVWDEVARLLPQDRPVCAIDIGSGLGGLVLDLARQPPDSVFVGIELAPLPWLLSNLRARLSGSSARFVRSATTTISTSVITMRCSPTCHAHGHVGLVAQGFSARCGRDVFCLVMNF
ncbi:tRNA (guanine-N(7)-)-methyltransferase [Massilia sp. B-10]|nr:tRNA (guanine-N(7)-)-methyltransferase [Massilia sp. B-10]